MDACPLTTDEILLLAGGLMAAAIEQDAPRSELHSIALAWEYAVARMGAPRVVLIDDDDETEEEVGAETQ